MAMACYSYSDENIIAFRISAILIEEGTEIVKRFFERFYQDSQFPSQVEFFASLQDIAKNKRKLNVLSEKIYNTIYPNDLATKSTKSFDITVYTAIFENLLDLQPSFKEAKLSDNCSMSHLKRLRLIKNDNYSHIVTKRNNPSDLVRLCDSIKKNYNYNQYSILAKLELSIYGLCKNNEEKKDFTKKINSRLNESLDESKLNKYRDKISELMLNDHNSTMNIIHSLKTLSENVNGKFTSIKKSVDEVKESFLKRKDNVINMLGKILKIVNSIDSEEYEKKLENVERQLETTNNDLGEIKSITNAVLRQQNNNLEYNCSLAEIQIYFKEDKELYFKVLILSAENVNMKATCRSDVINSISSIDWNIIIDFDHNARDKNQGFAEEIKTILENRRNTIVFTYEELDRLNFHDNTDLKFVKDGEWTCYILANGCQEFKVQKPKKFSIVTRIIGNLLEKMFKQILHKQILSCSLYLNKAYEDIEMNNIVSLESECYEALDRTRDSDSDLPFHALNIMPNDLVESFRQNILKFENKKYRILYNTSSFAQIKSMFEICQPARNANDHIILPGKQKEWKLERKEYTCYDTGIEIYHCHIGEVKLSDDDEDEKLAQLKEHRISFLKGNEISPIQMYIHSPPSFYTYALRDISSDIENRINDKLRNSHDSFWDGKELLIEIAHDACAGATTLGRTILYNMRKKAPCLRIKKVQNRENLYNILQKLEQRSELPLIILFDSSDFNDEIINRDTVNEIQKDLSHKFSIRSIAILLRRTSYRAIKQNTKSNSPPHNNQQYTVYELTSELSKDETNNFMMLYKNFIDDKDDNREIVVQNSIVYWFGIMAFGDEYQPINKLTESIIESCQYNEKIINLMFLVCCYYKYSAKTFPLNLAAAFLDKRPEALYKELIKKRKAFAKDEFGTFCRCFVLQDKNNSDVRLRPVHKGISDALINTILNSEKYKDLKEIKLFFENFLEVIERSKDTYHEDLNEVSAHLFILFKEENKDFTVIIEAAEEEYGPEWVKNKLKQLNDIFFTEKKNLKRLSSSLGGLYARYVSYRIRDTENAIEIMKKTLNINDSILKCNSLADESYDSTLFVMYGNFYKYKLPKIKSMRKSNEPDDIDKIKTDDESFNSFDYYLKKLKPFVLEAIYAYREGQRRPRRDILKSPLIKQNSDFKYNLKAYEGESVIRLIILRYFYYHMCDGNSDTYTKKLINDETDEFIRNSEYKINLKLNELEQLQDNNMADFTSGDKYFDAMRLKIELLDMKVDYTNDPSIQKILKKQSEESRPFHVYDIVRALKKRKSKNQIENDWNIIAEEQFILESIIECCKSLIDNNAFSLYSNFKDLITAFIYAQKHAELAKRTYFEQAIEYVNAWKERFSDRSDKPELDPIFYYAILCFIEGYDKKIPKKLTEAIEKFKECKQDYEKMVHIPSKFRRPEFLFGKDNGLKRLVPFSDSTETNKLETFTGRLSKDGYIKVHVCGNVYFKAVVSEKKENRIDSVEMKREKNYKFYLMIRRSNLTIWRPQMTD